MNASELKTPVLFIIFNRPDTTGAVFEEIEKARPAKLFIAADGPRPIRPGEADLCARAREIASHVTWDCEVHRLYRDTNLGCKEAVSTAISWFFDNVEEGIILEDDCVPDPSFFRFCEELLERYRNDERVMMVTGTNYLFNKIAANESYFFSRNFDIWGWASWRRAWNLYDISMADWPKFNGLHYLKWLFSDARFVKYLTLSFQMTYEGKIDTWDYQWYYTGIINHGLCATPVNNLISNIGTSGTHFTDGSKRCFMPKKSIDITSLTHPKYVMPDIYLDGLNFESFFSILFDQPFASKVKDLLSRTRKMLKNRLVRAVKPQNGKTPQ